MSHDTERANAVNLRAQVAILRSQLAESQARECRMREAWESVLIGGNNLASALIGWLGAGGPGFPAYQSDLGVAREAIGDVYRFDAWVCWRSIMLARDAIALSASQSCPHAAEVERPKALLPEAIWCVESLISYGHADGTITESDKQFLARLRAAEGRKG